MPHVFIYGALMQKAIGNPTTEAAFIPDYKIAFLIKGIPIIEPGFAALVPQEGEQAWGIVAYFEEADWQKLTAHEISYSKQEIVAHKQDGTRINCITLLPARKMLAKEKIPSARYAQKLHTSAKHHQLPEGIIKHYQMLMKKGSKGTVWMKFIEPFLLKILSQYGRKPAAITFFLIILISFIAIIALLIAVVWYLLFQI